LKNLTLFLLLLLLLTGCTTTTGVDLPAATSPAPPAAVEVTAAAPAPAPTLAPSAEVLAPADATVLPEIILDLTPQPFVTGTLESLSRNCLNPGDWEPMVNQFLFQQDKEDLKELWEQFNGDNPVYDLMSSLTDVTNTYAHATTNSKMLLVGEYKIAINRPGAVGYAHCAVLIYIGGDNAEVGVGLTDATLNDTWSGFAYGNPRSEPEMRAFIHQRIGRPVLVRYHVSQDPRDVNFVRSGFFSPVMKLLWADSYFTRFSQNPDMLKDNVGQPRGPSIKELMELISAWPDTDVGVFLDYIIDPIL
jgi:hypothetical protein